MPPEDLEVDGVPAEYPDDAADPPEPSHRPVSGSCGQVYWRGARSKRLEQIIDSAARAVSNATGK